MKIKKGNLYIIGGVTWSGNDLIEMQRSIDNDKQEPFQMTDMQTKIHKVFTN